jgi:hypothetical protein
VGKKGDKEITDLPTDRLPTSALGPLAVITKYEAMRSITMMIMIAIKLLFRCNRDSEAI